MKITLERTRSRGEQEHRRAELDQIRQEICELQKDMDNTEMLFNLAADENLIESYIFERNAQNARMNYLCRLAKSSV